MDQFDAIERRRRNLRIVLFVIILATLPFYCAGILLWGSAPPRARPTTTATTGLAITRTVATATRVLFPSITPIRGTYVYAGEHAGTVFHIRPANTYSLGDAAASDSDGFHLPDFNGRADV